MNSEISLVFMCYLLFFIGLFIGYIYGKQNGYKQGRRDEKKWKSKLT